MIKELIALTKSHGSFDAGDGMASGVVALTLSFLCFLGVIAFHFPQYFTTPELRST
jgi:hypothetical protein